VRGGGYGRLLKRGVARLKAEGAPVSASVSSSSVDAERPGSGLATATIPNEVPSTPDLNTNLEDIAEGYLSSFKQKVLNRLQDLSPGQFEEFAGSLLRGFGFQKIVVTGKAGDGGIDGHGQLRVGLAAIKAAFQCKRWQQPVGPKEVQAFRGAIQGQFEQGYFFTTSTFTKAAQGESIKMGAAPVVLFGGDQIVEIMIEKGIGIRRRPVEVYEDQIEQLFEK
jgi:restriction system protein